MIDIVTANYFDALGPRLERAVGFFTEADGRPSMPPVVVLSHAAWRKHFGSDVGVIGRTVRLHRGIFTIAGVAPDGFTGTQIGYSPDGLGAADARATIDGNTAMLGPASAWLGLSGVLERPDTLTMARAAIDGRWKADRRGDTAVIRLIPRGLRWVLPAPESRLRLIGLFSVLILAIACLNVSTPARPCTHGRKSSPSEPRLARGDCDCCGSCSPSTCCSPHSAASQADCSGPGWREGSLRSWPAGLRRAISTCRRI